MYEKSRPKEPPVDRQYALKVRALSNRHPLTLQNLLDLDKQLPLEGAALDRVEEINTPIPLLEAIQTDTRPGNNVAAKVARAIRDFEPVRHTHVSFRSGSIP